MLYCLDWKFTQYWCGTSGTVTQRTLLEVCLVVVRLAFCSTDWLFAWLAARLDCCSPDFLIAWLAARMACCSPGLLFAWLAVRLACCSPGLLLAWLAARLTGCSPGLLRLWWWHRWPTKYVHYRTYFITLLIYHIILGRSTCDRWGEYTRGLQGNRWAWSRWACYGRSSKSNRRHVSFIVFILSWYFVMSFFRNVVFIVISPMSSSSSCGLHHHVSVLQEVTCQARTPLMDSGAPLPERNRWVTVIMSSASSYRLRRLRRQLVRVVDSYVVVMSLAYIDKY